MNKIELCGIESCTQCQACVNICPKQCISMVEAKDGFSLPHIDREKCIECGACMKACHKITPKFEFQTPLLTLACWTKRKADRKNSSSGGAFSVIARRILDEGGVVFGATMDEDLHVRHIMIESQEDLIKLQGSKYVQSDMGSTCRDVREVLKTGRKVLFSGTPCQIAAIVTFLKTKPENLITCDVVCHGVPSQKAFNIYLDRTHLKYRCRNFNFRFTEGWGYQLSRQLEAPAKDGASRKKLVYPSKGYYLRAFTKGLMFDESCYNCPYARPERVSDFTLADYWGLGAKKPFNHPTVEGISCLLVNSEKGAEFISGCSDLDYDVRPLEEAVEGNHNLSHTSSRPEGRDTYYKDAINLSIPELCKKYGLKASPRDYFRIIKQLITKYRTN